MMRYHACDACGGTGEIPRYVEGDYGLYEDGAYFCPVCLGAGRISDQMPVDCRDLARRLGTRAAEWAVSDAPVVLFPPQYHAYRLARAAARAAFRAVPGLKGE